MSNDVSMNDVLVYLQDVGGTRYLEPVLGNDELEKFVNRFIYCVHPSSEDIFKHADYTDLEFSPEVVYPISIENCLRLLKEWEISKIICTLSSRHQDLTNCNLILAARQLRIPTLGFMDHWKGYDRFFNDNNVPKYYPDYLGVIDDASLREIKNIYSEGGIVRATGHPVLETIFNNQKTRNKNVKKILIVSQPVIKNGRFISIFNDDGKWNALNVIISELNNDSIYSAVSIHYRPHPKEEITRLPLGIYLDTTTKDVSLDEYDLFIGYDSMLLIEAFFFGKMVIALKNTAELVNMKDIGITTTSASHLVDTLNNKNTTIDVKGQGKTPFNPTGSITQCVEFISDFIENKI